MQHETHEQHTAQMEQEIEELRQEVQAKEAMITEHKESQIALEQVSNCPFISRHHNHHVELRLDLSCDAIRCCLVDGRDKGGEVRLGRRSCTRHNQVEEGNDRHQT